AHLAASYLEAEGWLLNPTEDDLGYLATIVPAAAASVDRLDQIPARLRFLFDYSPQRALENDAVRAEATSARDVIAALAETLAGREPMLDRDAFRAAAAVVRDRTGKKG